MSFEVPGSVRLDVLKAALSRDLEGLRISEEKPASCVRSYYDSFDWRLYRAGVVLEEKICGEEARLCWRNRESGRLERYQRIGTVPRFAWDLPMGPVRDRLEPVLEMRALRPLARVQVASTTLRVLNSDDKTVLRLELEDACLLHTDGTQGAALGACLRVVPVKGYDKLPATVLGVIRGVLGLSQAPEGLFDQALRAAGRRPGDYSAKLDIRLDPGMPAAEAARTILGVLLDVVVANEAGTRADLDSEFLHDFRVAVRRARSALSQLRKALPPSLVERFAPELRWLGQITGPTRDLDVYLLTFGDYQAALPPGVREDVLPLREFLQRHQRQEHQSLVRALDSGRYATLRSAWREFVEGRAPAADPGPHAECAILEIASRQIWRDYRRVVREGSAISDDSPATGLHELRKSCKKLRYALELFLALYPPKATRKLIKFLKALQDNLGEFQDLEVQADALKRLAAQMMREGQVQADTLLAMGMLVEALMLRKQAAREAFAGHWSTFTGRENRQLYKDVFDRRGDCGEVA